MASKRLLGGLIVACDYAQAKDPMGLVNHIFLEVVDQVERGYSFGMQ